MPICKYCQKPHDGHYASGCFCNKTCSRLYSIKKNLEKPKYKLAGKPIIPLNIFSFLLIHSSDSACKKDLTLCVIRSDWEKRNRKYLYRLNKRQSFIDITDFETLERDELLSKKGNFPYIAQLRNEKYVELKNLANRLAERRFRDRVSKETIGIIGPGLGIPDPLKKKLDILFS